jgi:hypothetical protein
MLMVPRDPRPQYSALGVVVAHYDKGLPPLGSPAWRQINEDRYILEDRRPGKPG